MTRGVSTNGFARRRLGIALLVGVALGTGAVRGGATEPTEEPRRDDGLPPWTEASDVPIPSWARSVVPTKLDAPLYAEPSKLDTRRGSALQGTRLPLFATRRGSGCHGRWLNVGPLAWICSDVAEYSAEGWGALPTRKDEFFAQAAGSTLLPITPMAAGDDGLPYRYYFAGQDGAFGFASLASALEDAPDQELERGFAIAIVEERKAHGESWGRTRSGRWIAMRELLAARPSLFHGERVTDAGLDFAWVSVERANVYASDKLDKPSGARVRFERVTIREEKEGKGGTLVRISDAGEPAQWMRLKDLGRPRLSPVPNEAQADGAMARWIDVELASQTLVAYEGQKPVFATLVSTGKGPPRSDSATHPGVFRIWVKLASTKMDNLENEEAENHYAIEDVPWVQFFDKAIGLHAAFWHRDFGHVHSHGCVNLAPLDARWLFAFTGPRLPAGWTASLPTRIEPGTVVRVR